MEHRLKKLKVAVIGVGYLGKFHAEKYAQMDQVELLCVVDVDKTKAENIAKRLSTKAYFNHKDIIGKVDAVSVVVPTPNHFSICRDFLEHDVDVLVEKPITTTLEEADELIGISESKGLNIQVGHLERFNPAVMALKDIVKTPMFIESHRLNTYRDRCTDVSVVLDLMIHDIDIILNFVDAEVETIHAAGIPVISEQVDIANARLQFTNGCVANVTASRISAKDKRKIRMFQTDEYISVDFASHEITLISKSNAHGSIPGMNVKQLCFTKGDALNDELKSFVTSVIERTPPEVTGQVGRKALKTDLSIMEQIHHTNIRFLAS
jgi:predicted dehydrogenase